MTAAHEVYPDSENPDMGHSAKPAVMSAPVESWRTLDPRAALTPPTPATRVGADVWFFETGQREPYAAKVTKVWSAGCVNLIVFPDGKATFMRTSVAQDKLDHSWWEWPR